MEIVTTEELRTAINKATIALKEMENTKQSHLSDRNDQKKLIIIDVVTLRVLIETISYLSTALNHL